MSSPEFCISIQHQNGELVIQHPLTFGEYTIGTATDNSIQIESEHVSRYHAKLSISEACLTFEDLGSSNGSLINGISVVQPTTINTGQTVQIGDLFLTVQINQKIISPLKLHNSDDMVGSGRYTLKQEIGRGGGGVVWLSHDEHLNQAVALKLLPVELENDPVALNDLVGEVQKARLLSHPNIIRIHDYIRVQDEIPFVSMEFVDGSDLGTLRNQQPNGLFTWERLEGLVSQMCNALEYAHQEQIIHRDLKPANMMITREGNLKLADFGIAARTSEKSPQANMEGDASGTMVYMSPQQMRGTMPAPTDDIYALGATLYDLLSTKPPFFEGDIYQQVQKNQAPSLSMRLQEFNITNKIPSHVESAIMKCLEKEPSDRPKNIKELSDLLHPGAEPPPPPISPPEHIPEMESVLAEPIETTQKFLEENIPTTVKSWWLIQTPQKRDIILTGIIICLLILAEFLFAKQPFNNPKFFLPW
tara:strand:+ start:5756 stop:7180 length:1425 start_codon:yes stop_codon:yes gene_type:complete